MIKNISIPSNDNLVKLFFKPISGGVNISQTIKEVLGSTDICTDIKRGTYPFVLETDIQIPLSDDISSALFNICNNEVNLSTDIYSVDMGDSLKKMKLFYNGEKIDGSGCVDFYINHKSDSTSFFVKINLVEFERINEDGIKKFCFAEVGKHIEIILSQNKKKQKSKTKSFSKSKTTFTRPK